MDNLQPLSCALTIPGSSKSDLDEMCLTPTQAANVVWLIIFGWAAALGHLFAAIIQACTIIGIGTAITNLRLMWFALCALRPKALVISRPTTSLEPAFIRLKTVSVLRRWTLRPSQRVPILDVQLPSNP